MNFRIETILNGEHMYLESLYPVKWTAFISSALHFSSIEAAKESYCSRYVQIRESLDSIGLFNLTCVGVTNGQVIYSEKIL